MAFDTFGTKKKKSCALLFLWNSCFTPCTGWTQLCELDVQSKKWHCLYSPASSWGSLEGMYCTFLKNWKVCLQTPGVGRSRLKKQGCAQNNCAKCHREKRLPGQNGYFKSATYRVCQIVFWQTTKGPTAALNTPAEWKETADKERPLSELRVQRSEGANTITALESAGKKSLVSKI